MSETPARYGNLHYLPPPTRGTYSPPPDYLPKKPAPKPTPCHRPHVLAPMKG